MGGPAQCGNDPVGGEKILEGAEEPGNEPGLPPEIAAWWIQRTWVWSGIAELERNKKEWESDVAEVESQKAIIKGQQL